MKNKKSTMTIELMITLAVSGILLAIIVLGLIRYNIIGVLLPDLTANSEYTSIDCDGDGFKGVTDPCPCVPSPSMQRSDIVKSCGEPQPPATTNCPNLCKIVQKK